MGNFSNKLKKFGKSFKTAKQRAKDEGGFGEDLLDGKYMTELESCEVNESQSSGRLQMAFTYKVTEGECKGETIRKYLGLETEDDQMWLDRELRRFGIEIESLEEVEAVAKILNDSKAEVKVTLKTKDSGQFSYVDKVLSEIDAADFAAEEGEEDGDDEGEEEDADDVDDDSSDDDSEEEEEDGDDDSDEDAEEEDGAEEGDDTDLEVGMAVAFEGKSGKEIAGKVVKILEDSGEVKVKSGDKTYTVKADSLYIPEPEETEEEEEEEEEEAPKVKAKAKKPAPKAAVKKAPAKKTVSKRR